MFLVQNLYFILNHVKVFIKEYDPRLFKNLI